MIMMMTGKEAARQQSYHIYNCHWKVLLERKVLMANFKIERSPSFLRLAYNSVIPGQYSMLNSLTRNCMKTTEVKVSFFHLSCKPLKSDTNFKVKVLL